MLFQAALQQPLCSESAAKRCHGLRSSRSKRGYLHFCPHKELGRRRSASDGVSGWPDRVLIEKIACCIGIYIDAGPILPRHPVAISISVAQGLVVQLGPGTVLQPAAQPRAARTHPHSHTPTRLTTCLCTAFQEFHLLSSILLTFSYFDFLSLLVILSSATAPRLTARTTIKG